MEIIKLGKTKQELDKLKAKEKSCFKCESVLSYTSDDVKQDRDGYFIICANCGAYIAVGN